MTPPTTRPIRARSWESFGTTADVGIQARAPTPEGVFEAAGLGMIALMTDLRRVRGPESRTVEARGGDPSALLVAYLSELLALAHGDGFLPRTITVQLSGRPPTSLRAEIRGELWDTRRHPHRIDVKAATYHQLELDLTPGRARARFILDI
ncbi:MAG: archease [Thermoplasmata archaeon]|nr:archease [Thermoplasmata archaeon]